MAGEAGASGGAIWSLIRLMTLGPHHPMGWAGLGASVVSMLGMGRWRQELNHNAAKLGDLMVRTRVLLELSRQVKDGYTSLVWDVSNGHMNRYQLDYYDDMRDDLMMALNRLKMDASML